MRVRTLLALFAVWSGGCSEQPLPVGDGGSSAVDAAAVTRPVVDASPDGPFRMDLAPPAIKLAPAANDFGSVEVGTMSAPFTFTVANTGSGVAARPEISISSPDSFTQTNDCAALPGGGSCRVTVVFRPASLGTKNGTLMVTSVPGGLASAALTGVGVVAALAVTPMNHEFGPGGVGSQSDPFTFSVINTGGAMLTSLSVVLTGADFVAPMVGNKCAGLLGLAPGASCTVAVGFKPVTRGLRAGMLVASGAGQTVTTPMAGSGLSPPQLALSPSILNFLGVVGQAGAPVTITVVNTGDQSTGEVNVALGGANAADFKIAGNTCLAPLAFASTCQITISVNAATAGMKAATLTASSPVGGMATATLTATVVTP
jgi:hypothetical protein